jgi:hypothetical protein
VVFADSVGQILLLGKEQRVHRTNLIDGGSSLGFNKSFGYRSPSNSIPKLFIGKSQDARVQISKYGYPCWTWRRIAGSVPA